MVARRRIPREEVKRYVQETPFTRGEVLRLWRRFSELDAKGDGNDCLSIQEMLAIDELKCNPFAPRIVALFSEDGSGSLNFQKFINMMSVFSSRASPETKLVWAFALWDFDGDDLIGNRDIKKGLYLLTNASMAVLDVVADDDPDVDKPAFLKGRGARRNSGDISDLLSTEQIAQILERIADEIDPEGTGLTYSDFENIVQRMPDFLSTFRMSV
ncbi:hypothetical protein WJX72_005365 [[Myrmecia] bisecta]|uniref:Uncharacterized protein n=1 Tax=[Myrmecia] bisecta TaxID=41462 RepID=A0AAW1QAI4_9CHLO